MVRSLGFFALFVGLAGCATETFRGADVSTEGESTAAQTVAANGPEVHASTAPTAAPATSDTCDPTATRACSERYVDAEGTAHCLGATQFCRADGEGWLPCGIVPTDADAGN